MTHKKILFRFYSNIFEKEMVETLWGIELDKNKGIYQIDNIPFYVPSVATNDKIFAEFDKNEEMLTFRKVLEYSKNSIIQVIIMNESNKPNEIRKLFEKLGCESEKLNGNYFSMEIPENVNYSKIKSELEKMKKNGILDYAESVLSDKHRAEI